MKTSSSSSFPAPSPSSIYDVVIVGAGVTGLALAMELLRQGVGVDRLLLLDSSEKPCIQTKGSGLQPRTLELLAQYEGVLENIASRGNTRERLEMEYVTCGSSFNESHQTLQGHLSHFPFNKTKRNQTVCLLI